MLAGTAMLGTVAIPWLIGRAIDDIDNGDRAGLELLCAGLIVAGVVRLGFSVARRIVSGNVSLAVEYDLRNGLYGHLQALELGFFDRQQTGQLMSRATVDLQSIRFFLGYGFVWIVQSALTILLRGRGDVRPATQGSRRCRSCRCRSWSSSPSATGAARGRRIQEVQQRIGELTAEAEENVSGVRVVKAFAAEPRQLERFRHQVGRVFEQAMYSTRLSAFYQPFIGFLPQLGLAAILIVGGRRVIDGTLTLGELHGLLHVPADADRADAHARHRARLRPARDRVGRAAVRDPRPRAPDRLAGGRAAAARGQRARGAARRLVHL